MQTHGEVWGCFGILRIAQTLSKAGTPDLKLEDVHYLQVIALSTIAKTRRGHLLGFVNECPSGFKTEHVTTSTKGELKCWTWLIRMHFTMWFYVNDGCVLSSATGGVYQNLVTNWNCLLRNQDHLLTQKASAIYLQTEHYRDIFHGWFHHDIWRYYYSVLFRSMVSLIDRWGVDGEHVGVDLKIISVAWVARPVKAVKQKSGALNDMAHLKDSVW